jgi:ribonuclease P protein component
MGLWDQRLTTSRRLRSAGEFKELMQPQNKIVAREFIMFFSFQPDLQKTLESKAGFIASKTVGGAIARNRCKRLLREAYRKMQGHPDKPLAGLRLVCLARKGCVQARLEDLENSLRWGLRKWQQLGADPRISPSPRPSSLASPLGKTRDLG